MGTADMETFLQTTLNDPLGNTRITGVINKMNFKDFILYTFLGSAIWNIILGYIGYFLYSQKENIELYYKELAWGMVFLGVLFVGYYVFKAYRKKTIAKQV